MTVIFSVSILCGKQFERQYRGMPIPRPYYIVIIILLRFLTASDAFTYMTYTYMMITLSGQRIERERYF